jgi:NAD(P)-dependent dehydrogenase (short-subunit alcohol dehydrogenase family)
MELNNKVAVITGVSKGIGHALCIQLLAKGMQVYGLGRNNAVDLVHDNFHFILKVYYFYYSFYKKLCG